jgi:DUF4097 and DUF4098 domain-containing protein YvlB
MIRRIGFALLACAFLAGCGVSGLAGLNDRFKAEDSVSKTFKITRLPRVAVDTFNGEVTVTIGDSSAVKAVVTKWSTGNSQEAAEDGLVAIEVSLTQEADAIQVTSKLNHKTLLGSRGANVALQVPEGAALELHTSNGKVAATGKTGDMLVKTSNGPVEVKASKGKLDLSSSNGKIVVRGGAGKLALRTSNGDIDVQSDDAVVDAETSNGNVLFAGSLGDGDHVFQTHNGKITLSLPAAARFRIDAETKNGKIDSDYRIKIAQRRTHATMQGSTSDDSAAARIKVRTANGSIELRKRND